MSQGETPADCRPEWYADKDWLGHPTKFQAPGRREPSTVCAPMIGSAPCLAPAPKRLESQCHVRDLPSYVSRTLPTRPGN